MFPSHDLVVDLTTLYFSSLSGSSIQVWKYPPTKNAGDGLLGLKTFNGSFNSLPTRELDKN